MADFGRADLRKHCEERTKIENWLEKCVAALEGVQLFQVGLESFYMYPDGDVEVQVYFHSEETPRTLTYSFDELVGEVRT